MVKKVLILSCGTGGGHNSAALAIQEKLIEKGIQADFIEYLDIINEKIKNKVNNLYINSTNMQGKVFKTVYHLGEIYEKTKIKSPVYQLNSLSKNKLYTYIVENGYDYIVTTHLFAAQALTAIKKRKPIHFIEIATDYVSIPFWEETNPDYFIIPSDDLKQDFINKGNDETKLVPLGIPVSKSYVEKYEKDEIKEILGLNKKDKYVLILTGSMGFGNIVQLVQELLEKIKNVKFIVSCGNNKDLINDLNLKYKGDSRVKSIPFTNKLSDYMKVSDIILSKPGGLTTTEIATLRKPFIHTMPIPGCENYNANFFSSRNMSISCNSINEIVEATKELLENEALQNSMIENQKKYISKEACEKICKLIENEIFK